jgi:transposase
LQDVSKRVNRAFERFTIGDSKGGKSGRPRFKTEADYRTMTFATARDEMVLSYRNEIIFTDCSIQDYWDEQNSLMIDRDINAAINLKRLGLDIFVRFVLTKPSNRGMLDIS